MAEYISREPMIREMQQLYEGVPYNFPNSTYTEWEILRGKYAAFIDYLKQQPAADVQPAKHGKWEQIGEQNAKCTDCGGVLRSNGIDKTGKALIFNAVYHYCPFCGARMDKS